MIEDVGKTIKVILYDRITSPLFGTFILSWCGWNWRLIVLFLTDSSISVVKKFEYIDSNLYPNLTITAIHGLLLPTITTAFFIYIYPWFARSVYGYWRHQQNELKKLQVEKDGEKPLTKKEAQEITNEALLTELRYQEEREKREARIKDLENLVKSIGVESISDSNQKISASELLPGPPFVKTKDKNVKKITQAYSSEIKDGMIYLLSLIENQSEGSYVDKDKLLQVAFQDGKFRDKGKTFVLHCLDNLVEGGFVSQNMGNLRVQPSGRTALIHANFDE